MQTNERANQQAGASHNMDWTVNLQFDGFVSELENKGCPNRVDLVLNFPESLTNWLAVSQSVSEKTYYTVLFPIWISDMHIISYLLHIFLINSDSWVFLSLGNPQDLGVGLHNLTFFEPGD
jgi:hypothetical protein